MRRNSYERIIASVRALSVAGDARLIPCKLAFLLCSLVIYSTALAAETASSIADPPLGLQSYEPSAFGYTKNNDDVAFYNIKLSVKFPLFPEFLDHRLNFAFTGAFGFYIGTRDSSPVVSKEFNPKFFWQQNLPWQPDMPCKSPKDNSYVVKSPYSNPFPAAAKHDSSCYVTIGYAHDSNGQSIDTFDQYIAAVQSKGIEAANDAISRGWDYIEVGARLVPRWTTHDKLSIYPTVKYFLSDGLVQGRPEELHVWEMPVDGKPRDEVDGLGLLAKYQMAFGDGRYVGDGKIAIKYLTGYRDPFRFSTVRVELGIHLLQLPLVLWGQKGYMSDLSQYYRNVTGYGLEIEIGAF